jgi:hypothetical protein
MTDPITAFALMVAGHAVADYSQTDFLIKAKNRFSPIPGVPWYQALFGHACFHGLSVFLVTGSLTLGLAETIAHAIIDDTKCAGRLTYNQDQALHIGCKLLWVLMIAGGMV